MAAKHINSDTEEVFYYLFFYKKKSLILINQELYEAFRVFDTKNTGNITVSEIR